MGFRGEKIPDEVRAPLCPRCVVADGLKDKMCFSTDHFTQISFYC